MARDVADIAADLLEAEKRGLAESQAKFQADFEAREAKFAESQAKFQADFEAREAKFNADLEALAPQKPNGPAKPECADNWFLARKCWAWLTTRLHRRSSEDHRPAK